MPVRRIGTCHQRCSERSQNIITKRSPRLGEARRGSAGLGQSSRRRRHSSQSAHEEPSYHKENIRIKTASRSLILFKFAHVLKSLRLVCESACHGTPHAVRTNVNNSTNSPTRKNENRHYEAWLGLTAHTLQTPTSTTILATS